MARPYHGKRRRFLHENIVELSERCDKAYKKFAKKANPKLLKEINSCIEKLKENFELGKVLTQDLKGLRSICPGRFKYRIVYEVIENNPSKTIIVHGIGHRKKIYSETAKYFKLGNYADPEDNTPA